MDADAALVSGKENRVAAPDGVHMETPMKHTGQHKQSHYSA
jgi:hypothetical protein